MPKCPKCQCEKSTKESFKWEVTKEVIEFEKCNQCGSIIDVEIERPYEMELRNIHSVREIRFSENEKRNLAFLFFEQLEKQNKILASIAANTAKNEDIFDSMQNIIERDPTCRGIFMTLLAMDDL